MTKVEKQEQIELVELEKPSKWPNVNARLLGLGGGLPVNPLDRLALFSADEFERFVLEWADGYLARKLPGVTDVQQRGGSGDKGRDIVVWFDQPNSSSRRWHLYQCKRYSNALGIGKGLAEIGKVLFYSHRGDYALPDEYWFVTRKGLTGDFQDLVDNPEELKETIIINWDKYCSSAIKSKEMILLTEQLSEFIISLDFSFIRVKRPQDLIKEHAQTQYHFAIFGPPLIDRPPPPLPPSSVDESERIYILRLYEVISEIINTPINNEGDFIDHQRSKQLFERSRMTFYSAEGLKELARDQMNDAAFFDYLLMEFKEGLFYTYTASTHSGYERLSSTVRAAQAQQISKHALEPHVTPTDREGICHHLANHGYVKWCGND